MNVSYKLLVWAILVAQIKTDCDVCQASNGVACHSRDMYSVCQDGIPTMDYITCPDNTICTPDLDVCYSEEEAVPTCLENDLPVEDDSLCGVCDEYKVFACLNETTIAFCFGDSVPNPEAISYCPEDTVCDINNAEYCSDSSLVEASCVTSRATTTTTYIPTTTTTTYIPTTTTTTYKPTTMSTTTTAPTTIPLTTTTTIPTTTYKPTTNTMVPTTTTTEYTTMTTTTTTEPSTITTTTGEPTTMSTTTTEPTTTSTTTTEPNTTPTITTETTIGLTTTTTIPTTNTVSTTTTTTPAAPRDPNAICKDSGSTGSYKTDDDVTCTKFVVCYTLSGELRGILKTCPSGQYFHPEKRICTTVKPEGCP